MHVVCGAQGICPSPCSPRSTTAHMHMRTKVQCYTAPCDPCLHSLPTPIFVLMCHANPSIFAATAAMTTHSCPLRLLAALTSCAYAPDSTQLLPCLVLTLGSKSRTWWQRWVECGNGSRSSACCHPAPKCCQASRAHLQEDSGGGLERGALLRLRWRDSFSHVQHTPLLPMCPFLPRFSNRWSSFNLGISARRTSANGTDSLGIKC